MSIGLEYFRRAAAFGGDRYVLDSKSNGDVELKKAELTFNGRVVAWLNNESFQHGTATQQDENRFFKLKFYQALVKANGQEIADRAVQAASGLNRDAWLASGMAYGGKQIKKVLDEAQMCRKSAWDQTNRNVRDFLRPGGEFETVFNQQNMNLGLPASDVRDEQLRELFKYEVAADPRYGKVALGTQELGVIAQRAMREFEAQKREDFRDEYRGLANFVQNGNTPGLHEDARRFFVELDARLDPNSANGDPLGTEPPAFRQAARGTLSEISGVKDLLKEMSYTPEGMKALKDRLITRIRDLQVREQQLTTMATDDLPRSEAGVQLLPDLVDEIRNQQQWLAAKAGFLDDLVHNDPLSHKAVAYSDLMWAHAAGQLIDQAIAHIRKTGVPAGQDTPAIIALTRAKDGFIRQKYAIYTGASTDRAVTPEPAAQERALKLGKTQARDLLLDVFKEANLPQSEIDRLTSASALKAAKVAALNTNQDWAPISRRIVVTHEGKTGVYESNITPEFHINPEFQRNLSSDRPLDESGVPHKPRVGVSGDTTTDLDHARNMKVSTIERVNPDDGTKETLDTTIGRGVTDMWDIKDPVLRARANRMGARSVLNAAISTNPRLLNEALRRAEANDPNPVKLTHVDVLLTTPAAWRELPLISLASHDYHELTYAKEHFRAFKANTSASQGGPVQFQVYDGRDPQNPTTRRINVNVDAITFDFGINSMATGHLVPDWVGGWDNVYEHNRVQMEKFIGDIGPGRLRPAERERTGLAGQWLHNRKAQFGSLGAEPGGFIGSVYDRLDENVPAQAKVRAEIRVQTNLVREMFTTQAFKRGNGDPAKMARHILNLQRLADKALGLLGVNDQAGTKSRGCKQDTDRGPVVDVENKFMIIEEDMGGHITPDQRLQGEVRQNYHNVAMASGQLENQRLQRAHGGSEEAYKLTDRMSKEVRQYVTGMLPRDVK
jgi:phosphatidylinositol-4,5-bisphosphate 4-phosphatase